jgi:hypothetical protein
MSAERDVEHVLESWLTDGIDQMPDRVYRTILDRVERQPQERAWRVTWRDSGVNRYVKPLLAVAAIVVVAVVGIAVVRPPLDDSVAQPTSPSPSSAPSPRPALGPNLGPPGTILLAAGFSEPFTFTMPAFPSDPPTPVSGQGEDASASGNRQYQLAADSLWGRVTFHDDQSLPADMCRPSAASIADVPDTPDAVGRWLGSGAGLVVSDPVQVTVDGQTALRWDVTGPVGVCDLSAVRPPPWFGAGERHRIYAVPTGSDTILVITWGPNWGGVAAEHADAVNAATDELVGSMDFGS